MPAVLIAPTVIVVLAAAARSTWSPCGWSMLSTLTPLSERTRGHRFGATAAWFVAGAVLGGIALGSGSAALAALVTAIGPSTTWRLALVSVAAVVAATFDAGLLRPALPHHRRQVNEDWLDEFRPWVYAAGFGAQIGSGLATYVMTAGVYLVVVLGAASGSPAVALLVGASFGLVRGLAVLAGSGNTDPGRLAEFHRSFAALDVPVRRVVTAALAAVGAGVGTVAVGAPSWVAVVLPLVVIVAVALAQRGSTATAPTARLTSATRLDRRATDPTTA